MVFYCIGLRVHLESNSESKEQGLKKLCLYLIEWQRWAAPERVHTGFLGALLVVTVSLSDIAAVQTD